MTMRRAARVRTRPLGRALRRRWRRREWALLAAAIIAALVCVRIVRADGGVTADARSIGGRHAVAFVSPAAPRAGVVDVSVLLSPTPPPELRGPAVRAVHLPSGASRETEAMPAHQGNRLLRSAILSLDLAGRWRIEVASLEPDRALGSEIEPPWPPLSFEVEIAPELPSWLSQWPWLFAWVPLAAFMLWRDRHAKDERRIDS